MAPFTRPESRYWQLYLETTKQREPTDILIGTTVTQRRESRAQADRLYHTKMLALAEVKAGLATPEPPPPPPMPTFDEFAEWYATNVAVHHKGAERELAILKRLRRDFGPLPLNAITKALAIEWRTKRRNTSVTVERVDPMNAPTWRRLHELMRGRGPMTLAEMRALVPVSTRDICSTIRSATAQKYFACVTRGVWRAVGRPTAYRQTYSPPSARTVNREIDLLQQVLMAAVEAGHLEQSPLFGLPNLDIVQPIRRTMSETEEQALLTALAPDDAAIVILGLDTLARLTDLLELEWTDVHERTLDIRDPKNGQSHTVPLSTRARAALFALPRTSKHVFPRRRIAETESARRRTIAQALKRACEKTNLPYGRAARGITFHWGTRRTGATRMIRRGGEKAIAVVQKIGNWKDANVLIGIYQETITAEMEAAVESVAPAAEGGESEAPKRPQKRVKNGKLIPVLFTVRGESR